MITWPVTALACSLITFSLMWSGKLQGHGQFKWLYYHSPWCHDFIRYAFAGILTVIVFTLLKVDTTDWTWQWLLIIAVGSLQNWLGEQPGVGWAFGSATDWIMRPMSGVDRWMTVPVINDFIKAINHGMTTVFVVIALRGFIWGMWFLFLYFLDPEYLKLTFAWIFSLPAATAMGAGMQRSLTPNFSAWSWQEILRWPLALLIAVNL